MIHPDTELRLIDHHVGSGVFATKRIPKGTITWALDHLDLVIDRARAAALPSVYQPIIERYAFHDAAGRHVLCWDHGRFVNHSCDATSLPLGSICEVAIRDILPDEQITSDYVTLNLDQDLTCRCGSPLCRGVMRPQDLPRYAAEIDAKIHAVASKMGRVAQPVLAYMLADDQARFEAVCKGTSPVPACREVVGQ